MAHQIALPQYSGWSSLARHGCRGEACPISGQTPVEELANALTHGLGLLLSVAGISVLVVLASIYGTVWHIVGASVYGATLVLVYAASTIYHSAPTGTPKRIFKDVDQAVIFLLIAGTYTPFTLGPLNGGWGWSLLGVAWGMALFGIGLKVWCNRYFRTMSVPLYLGLGWLGVVGAVPLLQNLPLSGLLWLALGGLAYSAGTIFYIWRKLPFNHAVWHITVMLGSGLHFFAVLFYVVPLG